MHAASRSLASYFDDTGGGVGVSTDWHDQMEASSQPAINSLSSWMWVPGYKKQVWVPSSANGNPNLKPPHLPFQEKPAKGEPWKHDAWGKDDYEKRSKPQEKSTETKTPRAKLSPDESAKARLDRATEKAKKRDERSKIIKQLHDECYQILMRNAAWDIADNHGSRLTHAEFLLQEITRMQSAVASQREIKKASLKTNGGNHKSREIKLHEETTDEIMPGGWNGRSGYFQGIQSFCEVFALTNTLGMTLPEVAENGNQYLSTASLLLSKAKEVIMDGILHVKAQKAKTYDLDQDECDFMNKSYQAKTLIGKNRGKDKPPQAPKKYLPDHVQVEKWKKHIRDMEANFFKTQHPGVEVPKHLKDRPPPKPQGPGKKREGGGGGKGYGGGKMKEADEFEMFKRYEAFKAQQHAHHKQHHPSAITPSIHPPKGNPAGTPGPPAGGGRGRRPNMTPAPPQRTGSYMPGYTYYCD